MRKISIFNFKDPHTGGINGSSRCPGVGRQAVVNRAMSGNLTRGAMDGGVGA